jgi:transposase-like protein
MGHKKVCFTCRKSFNLGSDHENVKEPNCLECGVKMTLMPPRFRPPKKTEIKKWETAAFLIKNGFPYHHIFDYEVSGNYVPYPENIKEAKYFIEKYKEQRK